MRLTPRGLFAFGRTIPCSIGKGMLSNDKKEGDGATPIGDHLVEAVFYRPDRLRPPNPWAIPIGPWDLWSDDPAHANYNSPVKAPYPHSHEKMRRADPLYDIVIVLDWNRCPPVADRGSAIFMHQWRRPGFPTEGCIAVKRSDLLWLTERIAPGCRLIVPPLAPLTQR
ncbi:MAG: L,D-transpeptidase family protein [Paracoccaceae bacterium]